MHHHAPDAGPRTNALFVMAACVLVAAGIKLADSLVAPLLLAAFVTLATAPLLSALRRRMPFVLAVLATVVVDIVVLAGFITGVAFSGAAFFEELPAYQDQLVATVGSITAWARTHGVALPEGGIVTQASWLFGAVGTVIRGVSGALTTLGLVIVLAIFMLVETAGLRDKLGQAFGTSEVGRMRRALDDAQKFLRVKTLTSLGTGVLVLAWTAILGVDTPLLWGLIAFALNYIPTVGSFIAGVPPVLIAWLELGPARALALAGGYVVINFGIGNGVEPRLIGRTLNLSPLVVLLSLLLWAYLLGPIGALLSAPLTVIARAFLIHSRNWKWLAVLMAPAERKDLTPEKVPENLHTPLP